MNDNKNKYNIENTAYHSATEKQRDKRTKSWLYVYIMLFNDSQNSGILTFDKSTIVIH